MDDFFCRGKGGEGAVEEKVVVLLIFPENRSR